MNKPTYEQIRLCEACLLAEAYAETMRETIDPIYNEVLNYWWPEGHLKDKYTGETLTHHNQLYRYDGDTDGYFEELQRVLKERNLEPEKPGCCPALLAECALRDRQREFAEACIANLPEQLRDTLTIDALLCSLKRYKEFFDINMRYVIQWVDTDALQGRVKP